MIDNHPLDNFQFFNDEHLIYKNKTQVHVMVVDGQVIGGYSYPIYEYDDDNPLNVINGFAWFSLDGRRIDEVKPNNGQYLQGKTYKEWLEDWLGYSSI